MIGKFFPFGISQIPCVLAAIVRVKGDGFAKQRNHPSRHPRVHLSVSASTLRIKQFAMTDSAFWPQRGRVLGWNDPTFCLACAPKRVCGVVPAHTYASTEIMVHTPTR
jgi:hypothetical protein